MGALTAANLARAGHEVTVWNRSPMKSAQSSLAVAVSQRVLAEGAEVVVTTLGRAP